MSETEVAPAAPSRRARLLLWGGLVLVAIAIGIGLWLASRPAPEPLQGEVEADEINIATKTLARVEQLRAMAGNRRRPRSTVPARSSRSPSKAHGARM